MDEYLEENRDRWWAMDEHEEALERERYAPHTAALTYGRLERLHFRLLGRWPRRVIERRLEAVRLDELAQRRRALVINFGISPLKDWFLSQLDPRPPSAPAELSALTGSDGRGGGLARPGCWNCGGSGVGCCEYGADPARVAARLAEGN